MMVDGGGSMEEEICMYACMCVENRNQRVEEEIEDRISEAKLKMII